MTRLDEVRREAKRMEGHISRCQKRLQKQGRHAQALDNAYGEEHYLVKGAQRKLQRIRNELQGLKTRYGQLQAEERKLLKAWSE